MTTPLLPPEVAAELADLRRRVADLERHRDRPPKVGDLADVDALPITQSDSPPQTLVYNVATGRWEAGWPRTTVPARLNRLGANATLTTTYTTLLTTTGFSTVQAGGYVVAHAIFDFDHPTAGGGTAVGRATLSGEPAPIEEATLFQTGGRATVSQVYRWAVPAATEGLVVSLQARKTVDLGTVVANAPHTSLLVWVYS